jgi:FkbM family methyltransferase
VNDPSPASPTFLVLGIEEVMNQVLLERLVKPGDVVYDVGANIGTHTLLLARLCAPTGIVYAFEPWPPNLESLQTNLKLNNVRNVQVVSCALSDHSGKGWFERGQDHSTGKLVRDSVQQGAGVQVPVVSLDDFVKSAEPPQVLKIDVEGAEGAVLQGAGQLLLEFRPVLICEVHSGFSGKDVRAVLQQTNYEFLVLENRAEGFGADEQIPRGCHILAYPREDKKRALASLRIKEA